MNMSEMYMFADDTKLYKYILSTFDATTLEQNCQALFNWSEKWLMSLNINKCKVLTIGRRDTVHYNYGFDIPQSGFVQLERVNQMKDLGVTFDEELSFKTHIYEKINKAYQMLGILRRNFKHVDKDTFKLIYVSLVRSQLEYAHAVWNPYIISLIRDLERVQKRATKLVRGCKSLPYKMRLLYLNLPSLKYRRIRGDMIEVFKMLNGYYDEQATPNLVRNYDTRTRGNSLKLSIERPTYNLRKFSFSNRVSKLWNSLPDLIVRAESVNSFKIKLDNLWKNEDIYYDWQALNIGKITL
jgi:ribonucleases P/MRP protein subunit RPP40